MLLLHPPTPGMRPLPALLLAGAFQVKPWGQQGSAGQGVGMEELSSEGCGFGLLCMLFSFLWLGKRNEVCSKCINGVSHL